MYRGGTITGLSPNHQRTIAESVEGSAVPENADALSPLTNKPVVCDEHYGSVETMASQYGVSVWV